MCKEKLNKELATQIQVSDSNNNTSNGTYTGIQIVETQKTFNGKDNK